MQTRGVFPELNSGMKRSAHPRNKVEKVMHEFKHKTLHSGSKKGPRVTSRKQAIAIGLSEQRKEDRGGYPASIPRKRQPRSINAPKTLSGRRGLSHALGRFLKHGDQNG